MNPYRTLQDHPFRRIFLELNEGDRESLLLDLLQKGDSAKADLNLFLTPYHLNFDYGNREQVKLIEEIAAECLRGKSYILEKEDQYCLYQVSRSGHLLDLFWSKERHSRASLSCSGPHPGGDWMQPTLKEFYATIKALEGARNGVQKDLVEKVRLFFLTNVKEHGIHTQTTIIQDWDQLAYSNAPWRTHLEELRAEDEAPLDVTSFGHAHGKLRNSWFNPAEQCVIEGAYSWLLGAESLAEVRRVFNWFSGLPLYLDAGRPIHRGLVSIHHLAFPEGIEINTDVKLNWDTKSIGMNCVFSKE